MIDRASAIERTDRAVRCMTNWQNTRYMREIGGKGAGDDREIMAIAERWAETPRRDVSRETMED